MKIFYSIYYKLYFKYQKFKCDEIRNTLSFCGKNVTFEFPVIIHGRENIKIQDNVSINAFVHIWGNAGLDIGENTLIASHVAITTLTHDKNSLPYRTETISKRIIIGKNVWIGSHAVILPGVTIGDNAIIGAGALVNKDVPSGEIYIGIPAKPVNRSQNDEIT